ncbi:tripartite tricarboxylate transporter substrate binding protein [Alkalihalobacillus oceani]|uniref:Tripartite tricarboxylate transporter substrate binding protein n=1 Tax=Halalkalibacter oceani TaxID=1653776 RepID=A0A9X2DU11_9BACI|nr:tripartite tricarboxylate transporter substrate binding protein [Halalkalibacter oceani]MCM3716641.1 tripartite tricarboxylate transporter substrate binding protein [Halalkalibacter oceani]
MKKLLFVLLMFLFIAAGCNSNADGGASNDDTNAESQNEYPQESIQVIVPYSAGGGTDTFARLAMNPIESELGQSLIIVNKPGASGETGATEIANSEANGYNLGYISLLDFALLPSIKETTYDYDQFEFLASFTESSAVMIAGKDTGFETIEDVINSAKERPGGISVSVSGDGHKYILMQLEQEAGVDLTPVSYSGGGESLNAVLGGHVDVAIISQAFVQQTEEQGLKTLAVANEERVDVIDHVPTFIEGGYNVSAVDSRIMVAPKGIPEEIAAILKESLDRVGESGTLAEPIAEIGDVFAYRSGDELDEFINNAIQRIQEVVEGNESEFQTN